MLNKSGVQYIQGENEDRYVAVKSIYELLESYCIEVENTTVTNTEVSSLDKERMLSKTEAATYLDVSISTLDRLRLKGEVKALKHGKNPRPRVVFSRKELDRYLDTL